ATAPTFIGSLSQRRANSSIEEASPRQSPNAPACRPYLTASVSPRLLTLRPLSALLHEPQQLHDAERIHRLGLHELETLAHHDGITGKFRPPADQRRCRRAHLLDEA